MIFMQRCLELAQRGRGMVAPNPMVGSVLVNENRIIGEGFHQQYGKAHAEVNCIQSVATADQDLIQASTLYVSLEPCAHFGKTPPCADLIIQHKIPKVIIACNDSFDQVNGKGIEKLKAAGVDVQIGLLQKQAVELNKRFFTYHEQRRPYIILKWAETANGIMGRVSNERLMISGSFTQMLVHQWRNEEHAILVGTNTVLKDNPQLTDRYFNKRQPIRIILDRELKVTDDYHVMNAASITYVMNQKINQVKENIHWIKIDDWSLENLLKKWHELHIQSILVEGGYKLLQSFLDENIWDELRVIQNNQVVDILDPIASPKIPKAFLQETLPMENDTIFTYVPFRNVNQ